MTRIEVTAIDACDRCKGTKWERLVGIEFPTGASFKSDQFIVCPTCGGTGETRQVVTCRDCSHFEAGVTPIKGTGMCHYDEDMCVFSDWGCKSFEAKEGTHGNG